MIQDTKSHEQLKETVDASSEVPYAGSRRQPVKGRFDSNVLSKLAAQYDCAGSVGIRRKAELER